MFSNNEIMVFLPHLSTFGYRLKSYSLLVYLSFDKMFIVIQ